MNRLAVPAIALALAAGLAGYVVRGQPQLPAAPAPSVDRNAAIQSEAEKASAALLERNGDVRAWLTLSDALLRDGETKAAVDAMQSAVAQAPNDVSLWVQYGVALVAHADGEVVPAARLAFDRASRLDPAHPAPDYYLGLSWMQAGEAERAIAVWRALMARSPADAPWVPTVREQLEAAQMMMAMEASNGGKS